MLSRENIGTLGTGRYFQRLHKYPREMGCGTIIIRHGTIERIATVAESRRLADSWLTASNVRDPTLSVRTSRTTPTHAPLYGAGWHFLVYRSAAKTCYTHRCAPWKRKLLHGVFKVDALINKIVTSSRVRDFFRRSRGERVAPRNRRIDNAAITFSLLPPTV